MYLIVRSAKRFRALIHALFAWYIGTYQLLRITGAQIGYKHPMVPGAQIVHMYQCTIPEQYGIDSSKYAEVLGN